MMKHSILASILMMTLLGCEAPSRGAQSSHEQPNALLLNVGTPVDVATARQPYGGPDYKSATKFNRRYVGQFTYSTSVRPHWIGDSDKFWYQYQDSSGIRYMLVDCPAGTKARLFDHGHMATLLSEASRKPVESSQLSLDNLLVTDDETKLTFTYHERVYEYDLIAQTLTVRNEDGQNAGHQLDPSPRHGTHRAFSPDYTAYVYLKRNNLYFVEASKRVNEELLAIRERMKASNRPDTWPREVDKLRAWAELVDEDKAAIQLTHDSQDDYAFPGPRLRARQLRDLRHRVAQSENEPLPEKTRPHVRWAPDSTAFSVTRRDLRGIQKMYLLHSLSEPRPTLEQFDYPLAGDEHVPHTEVFVFNRASKKMTKIPAKWRDESYRNMDWLGESGAKIRLTRVDRPRRNLELCEIDTASGEITVLIQEGFDTSYVEHKSPRYLRNSGEFIWWSERSGWGHYYLYDAAGTLKNRITSGQFRADQIVAVDEERRVLYFQGNGREDGENPDYNHLYRVSLDGTGLTLMDPGNANHESSLSPSRRYLVDSSSRIDQAPVSVVRQADGDVVLELEVMDLSRLKEIGWRMPETFVVKAADGVTDLHGNMWRPFRFDPRRKYPIIAFVYPGPQMDAVEHEFSAYNSLMQLAQVGFIVVQVGTRGTSPRRSKAYASYGYFNIRDFALEDTKYALEQLAARNSFIDIDRAGIFGHSAGGFMTATAMLKPPFNEFFKVGVASAGSNDHILTRDLFVEKYHGLLEVPRSDGGPGTEFEINIPTNEELAVNLQGHLLLIHGEIDRIALPAGTMRLIHALIEANKRFDMLILPGQGHSAGSSSYIRHRRWEYFAEHLLGDDQPGGDILRKSNSDIDGQHRRQ